MNVLLSIKPEFVEKIFNGTKRYEFRRTIFKEGNIKKIIIYASSPVQKVIGEFEIDNILNTDIETLWKRTNKYSGISAEYFFKYFSEKEIGYAIKIKNAKRYRRPLSISKDFNSVPPQSFLYLK
jgi:predicted transcriptional regulator